MGKGEICGCMLHNFIITQLYKVEIVKICIFLLVWQTLEGKRKDLLISTPLHTSTLAFPLNHNKSITQKQQKFLTNFKPTETNNV